MTQLITLLFSHRIRAGLLRSSSLQQVSLFYRGPYAPTKTILHIVGITAALALILDLFGETEMHAFILKVLGVAVLIKLYMHVGLMSHLSRGAGYAK